MIPVLRKRFCFILLFSALCAAGCNSVKNITHENRVSTIGNESPDVLPPVNYSVLIYIHGDGDYLFHDSEGSALQADEHALEKAVEAAEKAEQGEVFIFHHRAQRKIIGLFPRNTSRVYHYRGGELQNELSYRLVPDQKAFLVTEAELYKRYRSDINSPGHRHFFLYFGHEIPEFPGHVYHKSRPRTEVYTESFISGIEEFLVEGDSFNMLGLSTCNNGTATMMAQMEGVADVVLASPQNLHLSHLDIGALSLLEADPDVSPGRLAGTIAEDTFQRLSRSIQTAITFSLFNIEEINPYISDLSKHYPAYLESPDPRLSQDNTDCSRLNFFDSSHYTDGVSVLFKPAAFGLNSQVAKHTGWGCKPL